MAPQPGLELGGRYGLRIEQFADLMSRRVLEVLLVASEYDAFAFEEDGHLTERVSKEYRELDLNMRYTPRFVRARDGAQALQWLSDRRFDLVVTTARLADMELAAFCRAVKERLPELPIGVVAAHAWDVQRLDGLREPGGADLILLWEGDPKTLLALIKLIEDRWNADRDVLEGGVQAIVLVEDEVRALSALLPRLFSEVMLQTGRLADEGLNLSHRLLRARARPKLLLARTFEDALALYERYAANVLGLVSDCSFPRGGAADPGAGCALAAAVRARDPFLPVLLMSSEADNAAKAAALRVAFVHKEAPTAFDDVRRHLIEDFGFGDFVFRMPDGAEVARARDLRELVPCLERVPEESLRFHADRNHFSRWLKARTELEVAAMLRPLRPTDFADVEAIRKYLIGTLTYYLRYLQRHATTDFDPGRYDEFVAFSRIAAGSLGGKGRGLAFLHKLLAGERLGMEGVEVAIPQTAVIATDAYEEFVETNRLHDVVGGAGDGLPDSEVLDRFRRGRFPGRRRGDFAAFLQQVRDPIAVRSSGILEDSAYQPFAGVYATVMLPNNHPSLDVRLAQLLEAVKVVYASASLVAAREYIASTPHRSDDERMAVLLQRVVGRRRGDCWWPTLSGVAASYNFYPFGDMRPEDGVAYVAMGLGKSVVDGIEALRFCPKHPRVLPQFGSTRDILKNAQRRFYAVALDQYDYIPDLGGDGALRQLEAGPALAAGHAPSVASTYMPSGDVIRDGVTAGGTPLATFAPILRGSAFPLAEVLTHLLRVTQRGMGGPVEMEFAVDLAPGEEGPRVFHLLQVRPMPVERQAAGGLPEGADLDRALVVSARALGNGRKHRLADLVVVRPDLPRSATRDAAAAISALNADLRGADLGYVLIGPGRWGSQDPWLGIPVNWGQINSVRAIVETDFEDLCVEPSQGSHFFHNLTAFGVAFLMAGSTDRGSRVDFDRLAALPAVREMMGGAVRHVRLEVPVDVLVDGATGRGVIL